MQGRWPRAVRTSDDAHLLHFVEFCLYDLEFFWGQSSSSSMYGRSFRGNKLCNTVSQCRLWEGRCENTLVFGEELLVDVFYVLRWIGFYSLHRSSRRCNTVLGNRGAARKFRGAAKKISKLKFFFQNFTFFLTLASSFLALGHSAILQKYGWSSLTKAQILAGKLNSYLFKSVMIDTGDWNQCNWQRFRCSIRLIQLIQSIHFIKLIQLIMLIQLNHLNQLI